MNQADNAAYLNYKRVWNNLQTAQADPARASEVNELRAELSRIRIHHCWGADMASHLDLMAKAATAEAGASGTKAQKS